MRPTVKPLQILVAVITSLFFCLSLWPKSNLALSYSPSSQSSNGCTVNLEFNQDGVLPSSQGFTYSATPSATPEGSVFTVSGGLLHLNTVGIPAAAGYLLPNGYDPNLDFTLEFRMQVFAGTDPFGVDFEVSDIATDKDFEFGFVPAGIFLPPPPGARPFLPFNTADGFHTYKVFSPGGTHIYQLFIDGVLVSSRAVSGGDPGQQRFIFGDLTLGGDGRADIDYIHYCQSAPVCTPPPAGMMSWWPGDGDASDIKGGNHGTLQNGATFAPGMVGQAFSFDGVNAFVEIPNSAPFNPGGAFTVDGWFYIDPNATGNAGDAATLVSKSDYGSSGGGWVLLFEDRGPAIGSKALHFEVYGGGGIFARARSADNLVTNPGWYHIAAVFDVAAAPQAKIYLNGSLVATSTETTPAVLANNFNVRIGAAYAGAHDRFNGLADEVEFFNVALTQDQTQAIFAAGSAGKCKCTTVQIDIKPGSFPNSINLGSNGSVPVAILSTASFNATTVNPTTIMLASAAVRLKGNGTPMASFQDINGDGLFDLVVHISTEALQLSETDTEATLEGRTFDGRCIKGVDSIRVVP